MSDHRPDGCFAPGNTTASRGGQARAARLTAERRQAIARQGWLALVERHFDGDTARAAAYIGRLGAWAAERSAYGDSPIYQPAYQHPGPLPGGE